MGELDREKEEDCMSCRFSHFETDPDDGEPFAECRRFPPSPFYLPPVDGGPGIVAVWAEVLADSWCGEYERVPDI